jgi:hypothetical protein
MSTAIGLYDCRRALKGRPSAGFGVAIRVTLRLSVRIAHDCLGFHYLSSSFYCSTLRIDDRAGLHL